MKRIYLPLLLVGLLPVVTSRGAEAELGLQITPGFTTVSVAGDKQKFREDNWLGNGFSGGIESATLHRDLSKDTTLDVDGRAYFNQRDYKLELALTKTDVGYVRAGFTQYRKFYDNTGGFYQGFAPASFTLNRELGLDIGDVYFEAGLTLPNAPKVVIGYERQYKTGSKSLLEWGGVTQGGVTRNIFPSYEDLDEHTDIVRLSLDYDIKNVHIGDEVRYEHYAIGSTKVDGTGALTATVHEDFHSDTFFNVFHMDSHLTEKFYWSLGYLYTTLDGTGDSSGSMFSPLGGPNANWLASAIDNDLDSHVLNLNAMYGPIAGLTFSAGVQAEKTESSGVSDPLFTGGTLTNLLNSVNNLESLDENLSVRYTKIPFTTIYAEGKWTEAHRTLSESALQNDISTLALDSNSSEFRQDYRIGFNTAPLSRMTWSCRYRHLMDHNNYNYSTDTTAGYPGFITAQDFVTDEIMTKLTLRPCAKFSVSLMYQLIATDIRTGSESVPFIPAVPGGTQLAGNYDANIYSVSATLTPMSRLYLTGYFSYQDTRTAAFANQAPSVTTYKGGVFTVMGTAGYALDEKSDATLEYSYTASDNFTDNSANGLPLGLTDHRHQIMAGLSRKFRENVIARFRYGFYEYNESSTGGINNYRANLVSANCTVRF